MQKPIVFVDTNAIDNRSSITFFFGGRDDLEKIAKRATIAVPRIVYDEVSRHLTGFLRSQRDSFKKNPHRHLLNISEEQIDSIDHKMLVQDLADNDAVKFEIIELEDLNRAYKEVYTHAVEGTAPFEPNGDKGFKDTLIAKTIDQYAERHPERVVFLFTKDIKLTEYFQEKSIQVIQDFEDFDREYSEDKISEIYLAERIAQYLNDEGIELVGSPVPTRQWLNYEGNIVCIFNTVTDEGVHVIVDSTAREPIMHSQQKPAMSLARLKSIGSFSGAHEAIADIDEIFAYFSLDQIKLVAQIMIENDQIYGICADHDILQFATRLFHALDDNSEAKLLEQIRERYKLNLLTKAQLNSLPF